MKNSQYRIEYVFNNTKFGFSNSVTIEAISTEQAKTKAYDDILGVYGSGMIKRFTLKEPVLLGKAGA